MEFPRDAGIASFKKKKRWFRYLLPEFLTIGKDSSCQIILQNEGVCDRHARVEKRADIFWVRDLRSTTGTYVNDVQVMEAQFTVGDILKGGGTKLNKAELLKQISGATESGIQIGR